MSFQAMTWAIEQKTGSPRSKCVLWSIANYAGPLWFAYPKQDLIAEESEQSPDSVQKYLSDLIAAGLVRRIKLKRFGRRTHDFLILKPSPLFKASVSEVLEHLPSGCDVMEDAAAIDGSAQAEETAIPPHDVPPDAAATDGSVCEPTLPPPAVDAADVQRQPMMEPVRNLKEESPQPPKGGAVDDGWKEFEKAWQEPILRQSIARDEWRALKPDDRKLAIKAARGYVAWRAGQKKPPNVINAHTFLRERDAWDKFAEIASGHTATGAVQKLDRGSDKARAVEALYAIAGRPIGASSIMRSTDGGLHYRREVTDQLLALADLPPSDQWPALEFNQSVAWNKFLEKYVTSDVWTRLAAGSRAPHPWPPTVAGTWSPLAPDSGSSEEQPQEFAKAR